MYFRRINFLLKEFRFKIVFNNFIRRNIRYDKKNKIVLFWEFGGFPLIFKKNIIFSKALNLRGFKTVFILCNGIGSACIQRDVRDNSSLDKWNDRCEKCVSDMLVVAKKYKINYAFASDFLEKIEIEKIKFIANNTLVSKIKNYSFFNIDVGHLAWSSFNRYMKGHLVGYSDLNKMEEEVYRRYFYSALVNTYISNQIIEKYKPTSVFTSHGVYVDYAPVIFLAHIKKVFSMSWASGYGNFLHYFTLPKTEKVLSLRGIEEKYWLLRKSNELSKLENLRLDDFFKKRYFQKESRDILIFSKPQNKDFLRKELKIFNDNPIVVFFTHVNWDACFDFMDMIFDNSNDWVVKSIEQMFKIRDVNWIIRIHPGELVDESAFTTDDLIKKKFKSLPENIKILWSSSKINTHDLFMLADVGVTIVGTVGAELSCFGKPVITSAKSHYSHKGFTIDSKNKEEYFNHLKNIKNIKPLISEQIKLARQYAYSYFIQRQIPLNVINKSQGHWGDIDLKKLDMLLPGKDPALDKICDAIIKGTDVILDEKDISKMEKEGLI